MKFQEDLYAWSYLGCFDPPYLAIQLFLADETETAAKAIEEIQFERSIAELKLQVAEKTLKELPEGLRGGSAAEDLGDAASSKGQALTPD